MFGLILASFFASAAASSISADSPCPDVKAVENFNLKSFGSGKWYELGGYPNEIGDGDNCGWADYALDGDGFSITNSDVFKGKLRTVNGTGQLAEDAGKTGKLIFTMRSRVHGAATNSTVWIIDTDYDNYAVAYFCNHKEEKKSRDDYPWVFSRSKQLEGDAKTAVDKTLKNSSFIDSTKLIWHDFSDEACKYDA